jgi:hypothetical protein
VILLEGAVRNIVAEAYNDSFEFGLLVEIAAVTGARYSQIAGLKVADLQADDPEPRFMMPSSRKGKKGIRKPPHPVPIPAELAKRLQAFVHNRPPTAHCSRNRSAATGAAAPGRRQTMTDRSRVSSNVAACLTGNGLVIRPR